MTSKNYDWYVNAKFGDELKGKYVAIVNEKVICSGNNAKEVYEHAEKMDKGKEILLAKIPEDELLVMVDEVKGGC
ncbi:MAG: succinyl-CoA synthetase subunit alpha [Candidatus Altiarchaeales archaeon HGW-Altiarchaeales-3]|nr:MAG: succinyl-CoA synthetase subunit alpha [Candidatus Altiarchaeales archaeon HGW-Altiarchaeales-3]